MIHQRPPGPHWMHAGISAVWLDGPLPPDAPHAHRRTHMHVQAPGLLASDPLGRLGHGSYRKFKRDWEAICCCLLHTQVHFRGQVPDTIWCPFSVQRHRSRYIF